MNFKNKNLIIISIAIIFFSYVLGANLSSSNYVIAQTSPTPTPAPTPAPTPTPVGSSWYGNYFVGGLFVGSGTTPPAVGSGSAIMEGGAYLNSTGTANVALITGGTGSNGKVIIGAASMPTGDTTTKLYVNGIIRTTNAVYVGDIVMQKDGQPIWRMFEEPDGIYLESLITGKVFKISMQEVSK